jgi:hypothetical protein
MEFEDFLEQTISDYLENQIDSSDLNLKEDISEEIVDMIDAQELSRFILAKLEHRILTFSGEEYVHQLCSACGRSYGDFVSGSGGVLQSDLVLKNGRKIIIVDDF